jgi:hypothetical protein
VPVLTNRIIGRIIPASTDFSSEFGKNQEHLFLFSMIFNGFGRLGLSCCCGSAIEAVGFATVGSEDRTVHKKTPPYKKRSED